MKTIQMVPKLVIGVMLGSAVLASTVAVASESFENIIDERQHGFVQIGKNLGAIKKLQDGKDSDWDEIVSKALKGSETVSAMPDLFPEGSGQGSKAKNTVWTKWDRFETNMTKLNVAFDGIAIAAESKDAKGVKSNIKAADSTCKACHRSYRAKF